MDKRRDIHKPVKIGFFPIKGFALMSFAASTEPFRAANLLSNRPLYETFILSSDLTPVKSSGAAFVEPDEVLSAATGLDYLFVIAGGDPNAFHEQQIFSALRRQARHGVVLGGVSGGPVILAKAGLLENRRMTVHWEHADSLRAAYPNLLLLRSIYVMDRDRVTCGGGTAPMDLMHAIIAHHNGREFARRVSDWFLHTDIRPPKDPQRSGLVERLGTSNPAILAAVELMEHHLADPLSLAQLAAISGVSARHLNRLFVSFTGTASMAYYRSLRLDSAKRLLRKSKLSLTEIAALCGFANSAHFAASFKKYAGQAPSDYRR